jgi:hypothetical protein
VSGSEIEDLDLLANYAANTFGAGGVIQFRKLLGV